MNRLQDTLGSHVEGTAKSRSRFDSDSVIDRRRDSLLAAQVAFRRLNGDMPQKELDLLQFSSRGVAESGTGPAKVVGSQFLHSDPFSRNPSRCARQPSPIMPSPRVRPILVTRRKIFPRSIPDAFNQVRNSSMTQPGREPCEHVPPCPSDRRWPSVPPVVPGVRASGRRLRAGADHRQAAAQEARDLVCPSGPYRLGACQSARLCCVSSASCRDGLRDFLRPLRGEFPRPDRRSGVRSLPLRRRGAGRHPIEG